MRQVAETIILGTSIALLILVTSGCSFEDDAQDGTSGQSGELAAEQNVTPIAAMPSPTPVETDGLVSVTYSPPFLWPAAGPLTSLMSPEHPEGIDIGLDAGGSKVVRAAARGAVLRTSSNNEEPLGVSIVIDHGNGVTTTYGHLSQLHVSEGDEVSIGQTIGIGGSTGISTADHLHFEVRQDGQTVDPLDVLPNEESEASTVGIDCDTTGFTLSAGSQALVDLSDVLRPGESIVATEAVALSGGPAIEYSIESRAWVLLSSAIDFDGAAADDRYRLELTIDHTTGNHTLSCEFGVQRRSVPTTFYARVYPTITAGELITDDQPEPTATPRAEPYYNQPSFSDVDAVAPHYEAPSVSVPSYNLPVPPSATVSP